MKKANKITIIGAGFVGSTIAYTLMNNSITSEVILIDANNDRAEGEAMDITHSGPFFKSSTIKAGSYEDAKDSDLVIVTAGTNQKKGESRMDLINRNASIASSIAQQIKSFCPESIVLVVANPVDVMTRVIQEVTGFPSERVFGSGTNLDSSRLRCLLSNKFEIDSRNIHAYILGEHGDSEFAAWSNVSIAGMNINEASDAFGGIMGDFDYIDLADKAKKAAYEIINRKGATYYGIAASVNRIAEAVLRNEKSIMPVSVKLNGQYGIKDVYLSLPSVIGRSGINKIIAPYLSEEEEGKLHNSAKILDSAFNSLDNN